MIVKEKEKTMRKVKGFTAALLVATMVTSMVPAGGMDIAYAVENNWENDDSVVYATVQSATEFREGYIDGDGAYSSKDIIKSDWSGYTDLHKIDLEEDGTLLVAGFSTNAHAEIEIYNNSALTSKVGTCSGMKSDREGMSYYELKAGTYYYRGSRWNGTGELPVTVYLGFIPKKGNGTKTNHLSKETCDAKEVTYPEVKSVQGLTDYINNDGAFSWQDKITTAWSGQTGHYKFEVKEDGWMFFQPLAEKNNANLVIMSNVDHTSKLLDEGFHTKGEQTPYGVYLTAGTYYAYGDRWNGSEELKLTCYMGFMPAKNRVSVDKIELSQDKTSATVTFNYDKEYFPSFINGSFRVEHDYVGVSSLKNDEVWKTDKRENCIESNVMTVKENGWYTARIANNSDDYFCYARFQVTGIEKKTTAAEISVPKVSKVTTKRNSAKKATVKWSKVSTATGYKVMYATNSTMKSAKTKNVAAGNLSVALTKLKKGQVYYVKVCAVNGAKKGAWSKTVKIAK